ncbi:MAG: tannase/feruloyl esterase family alpha/beta hydrolase [Eudoraea sp.]|uniref:tannase/feruloyl esterase family alpha/beta hydrolase n=1 Tax=Eudoraea sp. TaxID=1979955 RepID=UPI0032650520
MKNIRLSPIVILLTLVLFSCNLEQEQTEQHSYLVINAIVNKENKAELHDYLDKTLQVFKANGGKPIGKYKAIQSLGGEGPSWVNWLEEIDNWVDKDQNPDQITVYYIGDDMRPSGSRLLCPYPSISTYDGKGDTRDVSSFICGDQE